MNILYLYFSSSFITLILLSAVLVMMLVNRKLNIPATKMLYAAIVLILVLSVLDFFDNYCSGEYELVPSFDTVWPRTVTETLIYTLRPLVILAELLIILPKRRYRLLCAVPAVINAAVYSTALFGSGIAFSVDENGWHRGALGLCVYAVQIAYIIVLLICSVHYFGRGNRKQGAIIMLILLISAAAAVLEYKDVLKGYTTVISAMCVLFYYFYLAFIHQQSMQETIEKKELDILDQELTLLRGQIDPDFIADSLKSIRSLARTDKKASAAAIDSFSVYLRAHMNAIRSCESTSFINELECVNAYLSLLQIRDQITVELASDLRTTDFSLPPLTLEAAVTYCIDSVQSSIQRLSVCTSEGDDCTQILVSCEGMTSESSPVRVPSSNALENACRRVEDQCGGTLTVSSEAGAGTTVTIIIPAEKL